MKGTCEKRNIETGKEINAKKIKRKERRAKIGEKMTVLEKRKKKK